VEVGIATVDHGGTHQLVQSQYVGSLARLPSEHSALLDGPVSVVLVSRNQNGSSHRTQVWLGRDDSYLYLSTRRGQVVDRNLRARPDVSFLLVDPSDPYQWMWVNAQAEEVVNDGQGEYSLRDELIDQLGLPTGTTRSAGDGRADAIPMLYRARPNRLMLFEKSRLGC